MKQGMVLGWTVLAACGGGEAFQDAAAPWQPVEGIPHALVAIDGQPTFYLEGERVVAEARAWGFIDYVYDTRGLMIAENWDTEKPATVTIRYDDQDRMIERYRVNLREDGSIVSEHRTRYAHEGEGGRFSELVEEDLTDGAWVARRIVKRTYEAGRLITIETKNPLDPNGEYFIETFIYGPGGYISDIDRAGYNRDGTIKVRQIRNLVWSIEGRVTSSRELDMVADFFYSGDGDLLRIDETVTRVDHRNPAVPWDRTFDHDPSLPASFWFSPWKIEGTPESQINFFGRF